MNINWVAQEFPELKNLRQLPQSGQRWVYKADHAQYGEVVLKLVKPGSEQYIDRELEAVQRVTDLSVGNVPMVHTANILQSSMGPLIYLIEQYIDGESLTDRLAKGPLSKDELLSLAWDLVSAAANAESVSVVHRDIKPPNIKIDSSGKAWLLDFGIVRILDLDSVTRTDAIQGPHSPGYSAPEQFRYDKRAIDGRADLFAIGVVIYESATGANPFLLGAQSKAEVLARVEQLPLQKLSLSWDIDNKFADFVSSITQKPVWQRPENCQEALSWLEEIIGELQ